MAQEQLNVVKGETLVDELGIQHVKREGNSPVFNIPVFTYDQMLAKGYQTFGKIKANTNGKLYMVLAKEGYRGFPVYLTDAASDLYDEGDKPSKSQVCFYLNTTTEDRVNEATGEITPAGTKYFRIGILNDNTWAD